jgi:hypothetical protein
MELDGRHYIGARVRVLAKLMEPLTSIGPVPWRDAAKADPFTACVGRCSVGSADGLQHEATIQMIHV